MTKNRGVPAKPIREITTALVRELFDYEPDTGKVIWRARRNRTGRIKAGDEAGSKNAEGYRRVEMADKTILVHHLIFLWMGLQVPKFVDHINGVRDDNRWENLRPATHAINGKNRARTRGRTLPMGVCWDKEFRRWVAYISVDKKRKRLGRFHNIKHAITARKAAERFYGFHENHGREPCPE